MYSSLSLVWSFGALRDLFFRDGLTIATWGLTIATALLVLDGWNKGKEMRAQWEAVQREQERERAQELERRAHDDQFRRLQWIDARFNSPSMIAARKRAATEMLEMKLSRLLGQPTPPIRPVIAFFADVARDCRKGDLDVREVNLAYRAHVMVLWSVYSNFLQAEFQNDRYADLSWLIDELSKGESSDAIDDMLAASISFVQRDFLEREASL